MLLHLDNKVVHLIAIFLVQVPGLVLNRYIANQIEGLDAGICLLEYLLIPGEQFPPLSWTYKRHSRSTRESTRDFEHGALVSDFDFWSSGVAGLAVACAGTFAGGGLQEQAAHRIEAWARRSGVCFVSVASMGCSYLVLASSALRRPLPLETCGLCDESSSLALRTHSQGGEFVLFGVIPEAGCFCAVLECSMPPPLRHPSRIRRCRTRPTRPTKVKMTDPGDCNSPGRQGSYQNWA